MVFISSLLVTFLPFNPLICHLSLSCNFFTLLDVNGKTVHLVQKPPISPNTPRGDNQLGTGPSNETNNSPTTRPTVNNIVLGTINIPSGFLDVNHLVLSVISTSASDTTNNQRSNPATSSVTSESTTATTNTSPPAVNLHIDLGQLARQVTPSTTSNNTNTGQNNQQNHALPPIRIGAYPYPIAVRAATLQTSLPRRDSNTSIRMPSIDPQMPGSQSTVGGWGLSGHSSTHGVSGSRLRGDAWKTALPSDWIPIIQEDIEKQKKSLKQRPFSDAYLSGNPRKKSKASNLQSSGNLNVQPLSRALRSAINSTVPTVLPNNRITAMESALSATDLPQRYENALNELIVDRVESDSDYQAERFPSTSQVFKKQ